MLGFTFGAEFAPTGTVSMLEKVGILFAFLGAAGILAALTFVTLLIGVLVNAMVVLMAGPVVDRIVKDQQ
jgi:hypothetical protein